MPYVLNLTDDQVGLLIEAVEARQAEHHSALKHGGKERTDVALIFGRWAELHELLTKAVQS